MAGQFYHVIQRGTERKPIFRDDEDRERFLSLVAEGVERFRHEIHAYCLMGNHFHLVVRVGPTPLASVMQNLSTRYVQSFNRRYKRVGPLFQGRYKAIIVAADDYFLPLLAYVHQNPVKARKVSRAADYRWSSHRYYVSQPPPECLSTQYGLSFFSGSTESFDQYVEREMIKGDLKRGLLRGAKGENRVLGNVEEVANVLARAGQLSHLKFDVDGIVNAVLAEFELTARELKHTKRRTDVSDAKKVAAYLSRTLNGVTVTQYGRFLGIHVSTAANLARDWERRMREDEKCREMTSKIGKRLGIDSITI